MKPQHRLNQFKQGLIKFGEMKLAALIAVQIELKEILKKKLFI